MVVYLNELTISLEETSKFLGIGKERIKESLKQNLFPFGIATQMPSGIWQYTIFRTRLYDYLKIPFEINE